MLRCFWRLLLAKESSFGRIISKIPIKINANGNPTKHANIILEYASMEIVTLQRNAIKRFGTALAPGAAIPSLIFQKQALSPATNEEDGGIFYGRVDSQVVPTWIKETFTTTSYAKILLKKKLFTFVDPSSDS